MSLLEISLVFHAPFSDKTCWSFRSSYFHYQFNCHLTLCGVLVVDINHESLNGTVISVSLDKFLRMICLLPYIHMSWFL